MENIATPRAPASAPALDRIPNGATVRLPDGSLAAAYHDGDGTYHTAQPSGHGGTRVDIGWRRDFLEVV